MRLARLAAVRTVRAVGVGLAVAAAMVVSAAAQETASESPDPGGDGSPPIRSSSSALLPEVDFYFPEGDLDLRLNRLIKNAFFGGQIRYNFVKGDILALLRYRYYALRKVWQIGVFDEVNYERLEKFSNDFERARGGLIQVEIPQGIHRRAYLLGEVDNLTSNKEEQAFSTDRTNTFVRIGYQIGTPDDSRSNAIVGESRSRVERLFSGYRKIGPDGFGLTGALTWSFDEIGGDFDYLRGELEGLKRLQGRNERFAIARVHLGTFFSADEVRPEEEDPRDRYPIPLREFFRLDGRERLKGVDEDLYGTEEIHATVEWFLPWFTEADRKALKGSWETWYWVLYAGVGTVGYSKDTYTEWSDYIPDIGFGFESAVRFGRHVFFVSAVAAHALDETGALQAKLSIKSSR